MATPLWLVIHNGGMQGLVATAAALASPQKPRVRLLHVRRSGSRGVTGRDRAVQRQAEHFHLGAVIEIDDPLHRAADPGAYADPTAPPACAALPRCRRLMLAIAQASLLQAARVVDPTSYDGDFNAITRATEQIILAQHLARLEYLNAPSIESPLAEMTDRQLVELGTHLGVAWEMSWSCDLDGEQPCGACAGCRRRAAMLEGAKLGSAVAA
jgi:hypothetical protein